MQKSGLNFLGTSIIPLAAVSSGRRAKIVSIIGGRGLKEHLINMGLDIGSEIEVLRHGAPGPFLIAIKETRLAIGQGMASKIMVSVE